MKVAVSSEGPGLESQVDPRFGRAGGFVIVDMDTMMTGVMTIGAMTTDSMITDGMTTGRTMAVTTARAAISMIRAMVATAAPAGPATTAMTSGETTGITRAPAVRAIHSMTSAVPTGAVMEGRGVEHACRALGFSA